MTRHTTIGRGLLAGAALAVLLCVPHLASAADGWYVIGAGGKAWFADDPFEGAVSGRVTQTFGSEYGLCGGSGFRFAAPVRVDGEVCVFHAEATGLKNTLTTFHGGSDRHVAGMGNVYFAPRVGGAARTEPYVGVGLGFDVERWGLDLTTPAGDRTAGRFDTATFLAYQLKAGVTQGLTDRLGVVAGYRYVRTEERQLESPTAPVLYPHSAQGIHLIEFGLRWHW